MTFAKLKNKFYLMDCCYFCGFNKDVKETKKYTDFCQNKKCETCNFHSRLTTSKYLDSATDYEIVDFKNGTWVYLLDER